MQNLSPKNLVFDLQSLVFEGSLAKTLRFFASRFIFWRRSRRKASFLSFKASFLKEVSQKSFVFELHFWRKSRTKALFLSFKASLLKVVSQKSFVLELVFQIVWTSNQMTPIFTWPSKKLIVTPFERQFNWQPNHLSLKPVAHQINWIWNHLNLQPVDSQTVCVSNQLTTKITPDPNHLAHKALETSNQFTTKSFGS